MDQYKQAKRVQASAGERARTSILDAAEGLFAREGPSAVTLRSIAAAGEVNIAAVNYYFGSKEKLFEAMFLRRIVPLNKERLVRLKACSSDSGGKATLESIVAAYVMPALQLTDEAGVNARAIVVQYSLGRVLAMPEVNQMLVRYYAQVREAFVPALQDAVPHLAPHEVIRCYYWMGGSLMVALAVSPDAIAGPNGSALPAGQELCNTMPSHLIAFLVQGISARRGVGDADSNAGPRCESRVFDGTLFPY